MNNNMRALKAVWLALIMLASMIAAIIVGVAIRLVGADLPAAVGAAGAAFLGASGLGLAARRFLTD